jgi:hypothetical protein
VTKKPRQPAPVPSPLDPFLTDVLYSHLDHLGDRIRTASYDHNLVEVLLHARTAEKVAAFLMKLENARPNPSPETAS